MTEFEIEKEYVGRVVGAQGTGINRLREQLAVKIDVFDEVDDKDKEGGKRKKAAHQKSKFKVHYGPIPLNSLLLFPDNRSEGKR